MFALLEFHGTDINYLVRSPYAVDLRGNNRFRDFLVVNEQLHCRSFEGGRHIRRNVVLGVSRDINGIFYPFAIVRVTDSVARTGGIAALGIANVYDVDFVLAVGLALVFAVVVVEGLIVAAHVVVFGFDLAWNLCSHFLVRSLRHSGLFAFHVPIVKIEPALLYHEEQVIDACGISQVERIFLPGRTRRNIHCSKERTVFGTGMEFKLTAVAPSANDNAVGTVAHVNRAYLGIEAVTHIGQVNRTVLSLHMFDDGVAARRIDSHAANPSLGFGFHAHERVKVLDGLYDAIVGGADRGNGSVGIPGEFFDGGRTAVAAALHVLLVMVEEEAAALKVDNAGVDGERGTRFATRHNDALVSPGARRGIAPGIVNGFGNATGGVNHVILLAALVNPRAFGILAVKAAHVGDLDVACAFDHVLLEGAIIELRVTPVEPCLAIVVNKHGGVDVVPVGAR